jgi:ankyrin repeat protein
MVGMQTCFELLAAGDVESIRQMIEEDASLANARDTAGVSLLMQAMYRGQRDLANAIAAKKKLDVFEAASLGKMETLADCRSTVNSYSADGFTPLHFACYFGSAEAARFLLENGAAVDAVATNPMRLMPLHSAASARNIDVVRLLLEHRAPVNARQHGGWVPLHAAAQNGDRAMAELLLGHDARPSMENDEGKTAAAVAKEKGHLELAKFLEKRGDAAN